MNTACALTQSRYTPPVTAKSVIGIGTPNLTGAQRPSLRYWRIFCAHISSLVGCARHPKGWPVPVAGSSNLVQSAATLLEQGCWRSPSFHRSTV